MGGMGFAVVIGFYRLHSKSGPFDSWYEKQDRKKCPCPCGSGRKYKRCCMDSVNTYKDCFGDQGGSILHGETPEDCIQCDLFDKCHKVTVASSLQAISMDLGLITSNGLKTGWLKSFKELSEKE